jgi:hypothetical protein
MKHNFETTEIYKPIPIQIADMQFVCAEWKVKTSYTDISYQDGIARAYMHLPYSPESEHQTEITLTLRGEDAIKLRNALQSLLTFNPYPDAP